MQTTSVHENTSYKAGGLIRQVVYEGRWSMKAGVYEGRWSYKAGGLIRQVVYEGRWSMKAGVLHCMDHCIYTQQNWNILVLLTTPTCGPYLSTEPTLLY